MGNIDSRLLMVSIRCATYNHAPYIRQCLDGFVMQKTNFRFEAIVHDDASTDGTTDIVREYAEKYPDIIKPMYETENQYSKNVAAMNEAINARLVGKYVALCEGDDYWTDPYKLQKQVDFLEKNPDYSLVRTNVNRFHQKKGRLERDYFSHSRKLKDTREFYIMNSRWFATCTWLFRNIYCEKDIFRDVNIDFFKGDVYLLLRLSRLGRVKYLNDSTAVYRILSDTASHFSSWKNWFYFSWQCKNTRLLFAQNESFMLRLRFWMKETIKVGYRAIRSLNFTCIQTAIKSSYNDFCFLFLRKRIS